MHLEIKRPDTASWRLLTRAHDGSARKVAVADIYCGVCTPLRVYLTGTILRSGPDQIQLQLDDGTTVRFTPGLSYYSSDLMCWQDPHVDRALSLSSTAIIGDPNDVALAVKAHNTHYRCVCA